MLRVTEPTALNPPQKEQSEKMVECGGIYWGEKGETWGGGRGKGGGGGGGPESNTFQAAGSP